MTKTKTIINIPEIKNMTKNQIKEAYAKHGQFITREDARDIKKAVITADKKEVRIKFYGFSIKWTSEGKKGTP
jgi:hypothetical protein